ncbi:Uncharacterized protein DAT39_013054 [Clarias magur]|uniref:Uncharacterized protein n=1 Tax=Clarias magur TaxID=1594786 RepID=A0A8J4XD67_CLAMG|nr:Uncharacterized protein DAT39_013054 [Clarias magur]
MYQKVPEGSLPVSATDIAGMFNRLLGRRPSDTHPDLVTSAAVVSSPSPTPVRAVMREL